MPSQWLEPVKLEEDLPEFDIQVSDAVMYAYAQRVCKSMEDNDNFNYCNGNNYQKRSLSYTEMLVCLYNNLQDIHKKSNRKSDEELSESEKIAAHILEPYFGTETNKPSIDLEKLIKNIAQKEYPGLKLTQGNFGKFILNPSKLEAPQPLLSSSNLLTGRIFKDEDGKTKSLRETLNIVMQPAQELFDAFDKHYHWTEQKKNIQQNFWYIQNSIQEMNMMLQGNNRTYEKHPFAEDVMQIRRAIELLASPNVKSIKSRQEIETRLANILIRYGCKIKRRKVPDRIINNHDREAERDLEKAYRALKKVLKLKEEGLIDNYKDAYNHLGYTEEKDFAAFSSKVLSLYEKIKISEAQRGVLRAAFSGAIENPKSESVLSLSLIQAMDTSFKRTAYNVDYNEALKASYIWKICQQHPSFRTQTQNLIRGLQAYKFPPEKIADITYTDIAWLINRGGRNDSLGKVKNMLKEDSSRISDMIVLEKSDRETAHQEFATTYEKGLIAALENYEGVYENPQLDIFIKIKHSADEVKNITEEIKLGRSGINADLPDFYKNIYQQLVSNVKSTDSLKSNKNLQSQEDEENHYKTEVISFLTQKFEQSGLDYRNAQKESENILNSLRFQFDGHHGEEISKIDFHESEQDFDYTSLNNAENIYQTIPEIHHTILHAFDNVDFNRQTYLQGNSNQTGIMIFKNPSNEEYWQYEIIPNEHVKAFTGRGCLIVDDQFYKNCKQFIITYKKQKKEELNKKMKESHYPDVKKSTVSKALYPSGPINKRQTPEKRMMHPNKKDEITK